MATIPEGSVDAADVESTWHKPGWYEAPGQTPIYVTDTGDQGGRFHGPWVHYRFPWEKDTEAKAVLWTTFEALVSEAGYRRVGP